MTRRESKRHQLGRFLPGIATLVLVCVSPAGADLVKLQNGGEVRGRIVSGFGAGKTADIVVLETLSGITVAVARVDLKFVTMRQIVIEEYETKSRRLPNTLDAHWELSEWCRQRSLTKQREIHLHRVVDLDPFHEKAQMALGRVWHEGAWVDRDEMMASRGYVKYKGRYVTLQELELIQKTSSERTAETEWYQKVKLWRGWITGSNEDKARQGLLAFQAIDDPHAAPAVIKFLCEGEEANREMRALGVRVLSKVAGAKGAVGLVKLSLFDGDDGVRYAALNGIAADNYEHAQNAFIKELKNSLNIVVCRAGVGLARVGDHRAVSPLIEALVTTHRYQVQTNLPAAQSYSMSTDGQSVSSSGLPPEVEIAMRTGQLPQGAVVLPSQDPTANMPKKVITVAVDQPNQEVLTALQKLTGQNFGYDERTWRLWWAAEKNAGGGLPAAKNQ